MATLKISNVHKSFGRTEVIRDVSLDVEDGELIVFVGPSGCGKSTMLRMIAGLEQLSAGEIQIGGRQVDHLPPARRGIAMVFQSYALYPHKDVRGNLGFALRHARVDKAEVDRRVNEAAEILGLADLMDRRPRELSGGQRQRVAIGRAIVREPDVFLFDEPLSNLDAALRVHMRVEILKLHQRLGNTMIYVTHDQVEAMTLADRIAVFRDGRVEQSGTPMELYRHPVNDFVAGFIGSPSMNFLSAQWSGDTRSLSVAGKAIDNNLLSQAGIDLQSVESGTSLKLGIRPEHLNLSDQGQFEGQVQVFENLGGESFVHINVGNDELLVAKLEGEHSFRPGDSCRLQVEPAYLHLFDQQGLRI